MSQNVTNALLDQPVGLETLSMARFEGLGTRSAISCIWPGRSDFMPQNPVKISLIYVQKISGCLGIAQVELVSMVTVNNCSGY